MEKDFKNNFPSECGKHDIEVKKSDIEVFDQGSYKLHTTIKNNHGGSIDRDVAVMFPLDIDQNNDPRKIKGYGRDAIHLWNRTTTSELPSLIEVWASRFLWVRNLTHPRRLIPSQHL